MLLFPTGLCKDKNLLALEADYLKRLKKPYALTIRELKAKTPADETTVQRAALAGLPASSVPILLHETGKPHTTVTLTRFIQTLLDNGQSPAFFIGGAAGFDPAFLDSVPTKISLSPLTFPHQMCRVLLIEQIYRAQTLATGHPYHRP